jgi:cell division protein ZapA
MMNIDSSTLEVFILDKSYRINCPEQEQESLRNSAMYLDKRMRDIKSSGKIIGVDRIAVLAALNIAHELLNNHKAAESSDEARAGLVHLIQKIEHSLAQHSGMDI